LVKTSGFYSSKLNNEKNRYFLPVFLFYKVKVHNPIQIISKKLSNKVLIIVVMLEKYSTFAARKKRGVHIKSLCSNWGDDLDNNLIDY
jgi:hypothetical protein